MASVAGRMLYLVGGPPRMGKSSLAQRLVQTEGIPWLPTDVVRTVLRRVLPELDSIRPGSRRCCTARRVHVSAH
jgi:predicted kinase